MDEQRLVLIVEDSLEVANILKMYLQRFRMTYHHCSNGDEALRYLQSASPDLILLDLGLPGLTGWQVLDAIRADARSAAIPVVILTAHADSENRQMGEVQHVAAFVTKPVLLADLRQVIQQILGVA